MVPSLAKGPHGSFKTSIETCMGSSAFAMGSMLKQVHVESLSLSLFLFLADHVSTDPCDEGLAKWTPSNAESFIV